MGVENPQAFPSRPSHGLQPRHGEVHNGMTLRDWFAGQALTAATSMAGANARLIGMDDSDIAEWAANVAFKCADAMLAARQDPAK